MATVPVRATLGKASRMSVNCTTIAPVQFRMQFSHVIATRIARQRFEVQFGLQIARSISPVQFFEHLQRNHP